MCVFLCPRLFLKNNQTEKYLKNILLLPSFGKSGGQFLPVCALLHPPPQKTAWTLHGQIFEGVNGLLMNSIWMRVKHKFQTFEGLRSETNCKILALGLWETRTPLLPCVPALSATLRVLHHPHWPLKSYFVGSSALPVTHFLGSLSVTTRESFKETQHCDLHESTISCPHPVEKGSYTNTNNAP